ncbi:MAG TPA: hypothetical protein VFP84_21795, partial [Kofleriaceae bacterium]|nr:hypothetical protein [Kofleriaceae bacterium]
MASRALACLPFAAAAACGWLPADKPAAPPPPIDPDLPVLHTWKIVDHVLGPNALISELDAAGFHGREVAVSADRYVSPWTGRCDDPHRARRGSSLAQLAADQRLPPDVAARLGVREPLTAFQLTCGPADASGRVPPLTCYVADARAVTCWSGVCYL